MSDVPKTYASLRGAVRKLLREVEGDAGPARMKQYHRTGEMIHSHVLLHEARAEYGKEVLQRLASDLKRGERRLYEMVEVYRAYPILRPAAKLRWSHYVILSGVKDEALRKAYEETAAQRSWSRRTLREQIAQGVFEDEGGGLADGWDQREPPVPRRGRPYTYRVKAVSDRGVVLDLGMRAELELLWDEHLLVNTDSATAKAWQVGDVVTTKRAREGALYSLRKGDARRLYTFKAEVIRVVDGDTVWMKLDYGFRFALPWRVRLRGVDAPELDTAEGAAAKTWVEDRLGSASTVVITTSEVGKFGRYIADVFYGEGKSVRGVAEEGGYLNGEMVREGVG